MQTYQSNSTLKLELLESRLLLSTSASTIAAEELVPLSNELDVIIGDGASKSLMYSDTDGTQVIIKPKSLTANITLVGDNINQEMDKKGIRINGPAEISNILFSNNSIKSQLSFSVKGGIDNTVLIHGISGEGILNKLNLKNVIIGEGGIVINNGYVNSTAVYGLNHNADIIMTNLVNYKGIQLKINQLNGESEIAIDTPIKMMSVPEWLNGSFEGQSVQKLAVYGNLGAEVYINGDVKSAKIDGNISDLMHITGNLGSLRYDHLIGNLLIEGNAKSISSQDIMRLTVLDDIPDDGSLTVLGNASLKSANEKVDFQNNILISTDSNYYSLFDLNMYDQMGAWQLYNKIEKGIPGVSQILVEVYDVLSNPGFPDVFYTISDSDDLSTEISRYNDFFGTWAYSLVSTGELGDIDIVYDGLLISPPYLEYKVEHFDSSPFSGLFGIVAGNDYFLGDYFGNETIKTEFLGHEQVEVPAGIGLAAKFTVEQYQTGMATFIDGFEIVTMNMEIKATSTYWAIPGIGIVKQISSSTNKVDVIGYGKETVKLSATLELVSYGID